MKTFNAFIAITATAALSTSPVHAQLLGGSMGGSMSNAVGGALSGSMMGRGGVDSRFTSDHSFRAGGNLNSGPDLSRPTTRAHNAADPIIENGKQSADGAGHSAAGKAESSRITAENSGVSAVHAANGAAANEKSDAARTKTSGTMPAKQSPLSAATAPTASGAGDMGAPSSQVTGDGSAANDTHASRGADGLNTGSHTETDAGTSATVAR